MFTHNIRAIVAIVAPIQVVCGCGHLLHLLRMRKPPFAISSIGWKIAHPLAEHSRCGTCPVQLRIGRNGAHYNELRFAVERTLVRAAAAGKLYNRVPAA